jgi:peptidoglycan hydrolase CwlO-like protein
MFTPILTISASTISKFALEIYTSMLLLFSFFTTTLATQTEEMMSKINQYSYTKDQAFFGIGILSILTFIFIMFILDKIINYYTSIIKKLENDVRKLKCDIELQDAKFEAYVKETARNQNCTNHQLDKKFKSYDKELKKMNKEIRKYE